MILKFIPLFTLLLLNLPVAGQVKMTINDSWRFLKDNNLKDINDYLSSTEKGEIIDIPHTWNAKDAIDENKGYYRGLGWYARDVTVPSTFRDKQLFLLFEGVNTVADVYINGQLAGHHVGGYTRFIISVSEFITFAAAEPYTTFEVLVKADNSYNEDIPPLSGDFTFFGGIYRDVNLIVKEKQHFHIEPDASNGVFINTPKVSAENAEITLRTIIKNDARSAHELKFVTKIYDPENALISKKTRFLNAVEGEVHSLDIKLDDIANPRLWSPDAPNLYTVVCEILDTKSGRKLDESINPLGLRWFSFDKDAGFFLNGAQLKLIGTNRHQDYPGLGNALPDHIHIEDVIKMKEMGSNFLRISHYPQDEAILGTCDRLGILTAIEIPIINRITESEAFTRNCLSAQLEMIRQNYNHPSLIIWAYMNEVLLGKKYEDDQERYNQYTRHVRDLAQQLEDLTRKEDPYRYTMISNHASLAAYKDAGLTEVPMIVGWNVYEGWYGADLGKLLPSLEKIHKSVDRPLIITEYGAGADPRLHTLNPIRYDFTQEYSTVFHKHYLELIEKLTYVAGANVWNYADFISENRSDAVQSVNSKGLLGIDRKPKDVFYYYQAKLLNEPFIGIATDTWGRRAVLENDLESGIATLPVQIFSNQPSIEFFINGKSLGAKPVEDAIVVFEVPFTQGINRLRAVGKDTESYSELKIDLLPRTFKAFPINGLSINLGDERFFYDDRIDHAWAIDKVYTQGSWGSVSGEPYKRSSRKKRQPYGTNHSISGTTNDPIYQTQLVGIEEYRFDVPQGVYEVNLHFAELAGSNAKHLANDLVEGDQTSTEHANRVFSVIINGQKVLDQLDILKEFGEYKAVKIKSEVWVNNNDTGIVVKFEKIIGEPILNAIELYKKQ